MMAWWKSWLAAFLAWFHLGPVGAPAPTPAATLAATPSPVVDRFTKTVTFTNRGRAPAFDVSAQVTVLPPKGVDASLTVLTANPPWTRLRRDAYGNWIAVYRWPVLQPGQTETVTLTFAAKTAPVRYRLPDASAAYDRAAALYRFYTSPSLEAAEGVNTGAPQIVALDRRLTPAPMAPAARARALFNWVVTHIRYNYRLVPSGGALATLAAGTGVCSDIAELYAAMLRTDGIPARIVSGYVTNNGAGAGGFHQWDEFYLPGTGWVPADPTWGAYGYFAALDDAWHIPLYVGLGADTTVQWRNPPDQPGAADVAIGLHYHFPPPTASPAPIPGPPPIFPHLTLPLRAAWAAWAPWWSTWTALPPGNGTQVAGPY